MVSPGGNSSETSRAENTNNERRGAGRRRAQGQTNTTTGGRQTFSGLLFMITILVLSLHTSKAAGSGWTVLAEMTTVTKLARRLVHSSCEVTEAPWQPEIEMSVILQRRKVTRDEKTCSSTPASVLITRRSGISSSFQVDVFVFYVYGSSSSS
ncbi:unnamed protein product [Pleuronectes platessa]|uniref:Uncharacterized protein n=1 Tax=Pleuronectes platessa TaxID=8262 RepID=A0A9N7ZCP6_PLEPL|nr:unnamed protein product [Pleuronectes platessa]